MSETNQISSNASSAYDDYNPFATGADAVCQDPSLNQVKGLIDWNERDKAEYQRITTPPRFEDSKLNHITLGFSGCTKEIIYDPSIDACDSPLNDSDGDGFISDACGGDDCNDFYSDTHPGAEEVPYDSIDQDCSGADANDLDGDGDPADFTGGGDCDDSDPETYTGATEIEYDGIDQDCDGADLADVDEDGYEADLVNGGTDCNDDDPDIHPGVLENYTNEIDDDCDERVDDQDEDGYTIVSGGDCNDTESTIYPGASENYTNEVDDNCDGTIDDQDGDGYTITVDGDCDDTDNTVFPGASEIAYDGLDQDCSGADLIDGDGDGYTGIEAGGDDCNDSDSLVHPGASESCNDLDDDCDGDIDEGLPTSTYYQDADGDGYGASSPTILDCGPSAGYVSDSSDCNDANASVNPGAIDTPEDGLDQNCSGSDAVDLGDYTVNCDGPSYPTIQAAVDAAGDGDMVYVCAGTYNECEIEVGCTDLEIKGESTTTLSGPCGSDEDPFISLPASCGATSYWLTVDNIQFAGADHNAGIEATGGNLRVKNSQFTRTRRGIGTWSTGSLYVNDTTFDDNFDGHYGEGSAIFTDDTSVTLSNIQVNDNTNGLEFFDSDFSISGSTFQANRALAVGGALIAVISTGTVTGSTIENNEGENYGGALALWGSTVTVKNSTIQDNTSEHGGGVFLEPDSTFTSISNTWIGNTPDDVYINTPGSGESYNATAWVDFTCYYSTATCVEE